MLNFPKDQLPALSHGKRRAPEPEIGGDASDIDGRPAKRPHLESSGQNQAGAPRVASINPVVRVLDPAPPAQSRILPPVEPPPLYLPYSDQYQPSHDVAQILKAWRQVSPVTVKITPLDEVSSATTGLRGIAWRLGCDRLAAQAFKPAGSVCTIASITVATTTTVPTSSPAVTGLINDGEEVEPVNDEQFEWLAEQVRDAKQVELQRAISTIKDADFKSPPTVTVWLQLCAVLCLHYHDKQDKEPLWQCLERVLLRLTNLKSRESRDLKVAAKTALLAKSMPAGFVRILECAQASKWRDRRLLTVLDTSQMKTTVKLAIKQMATGLHPEKTAQQAASDFLLARYAARAAHTGYKARAAYAADPAPAVAPNPPEELNKFETVNPEFLFMPSFGEDMIDPNLSPEFWWLAHGDNLAAHAFEPVSESTSTATTTTATMPTPAFTRTALQLQAAPDAHWHDELIADGDNERPGTESLLNG